MFSLQTNIDKESQVLFYVIDFARWDVNDYNPRLTGHRVFTRKSSDELYLLLLLFFFQIWKNN